MSISMTDSDEVGKLTNFSYNQCNNNSENELKSCRGLVYKNGQPFIKAFGYTPFYTSQNIPQETLDYINTNFNTLRFYCSLEGTLIRLFYNDVNDKWYISTHTKLDASKSRWGSKCTFGEVFNSVIPPEFYTNLDKTKFYMFILTPNETNRIVCKYLMNHVYHVGTYDSNFNLSYDYDIGVQKPLELRFDNINELFKYVDEELDCFTYQGVLICDNQTQTNIKILSNSYERWRELRGNVPSIKFRYLQLRNNETDTHNLKVLFPDFIKDFEIYEKYLDLFSRRMLEEYVNRHIKKLFKQLPPNEHYILKLAHAWHSENKDVNKINLKKIKEIINNQNPSFLNSIIKNFKK